MAPTSPCRDPRPAGHSPGGSGAGRPRVGLECAWRARGGAPAVATEDDRRESMKRAAAQGTCLAVLPEYVVRAEVAAGALVALAVEGRPLTRTLKLVWAADAYLSPVARAFLAKLSVEYPALRPMVDMSSE